MDIIEFLKPVIEKRTEEIAEVVLKGETNDDYQQFVMLLQSVEPVLRNELENYFLNSVLEAVKTSYRSGVTEASTLRELL
ncbi:MULTISPECIES: hypothetical protein [Paenibacillus]|uniref:hypothetical protein n=1 Tax=Paenibacillus TaxID=44249 RepID=UPI00096D94E9|nr:hypothetical protein [Paenibacillus odorifer]OMD87858.1 hypothetical protein BSK53_02400 [Paenibacillus odorifer]